MQKLTFILKGTTPLFLHNGEMANPLNPFVRKLNARKKKGRGIKEESEIYEIAKLEWWGGLYLNKEGRIGIPPRVIFSVIRKGARAFREGKTIEAGLQVRDFALLEYAGPADPEELFDYRENDIQPFVDMQTVKIGQSKVLRTRPYFENWELAITIYVNPDVVDVEKLSMYINQAGMNDGIGDNRSNGYGRFELTT